MPKTTERVQGTIRTSRALRSVQDDNKQSLRFFGPSQINVFEKHVSKVRILEMVDWTLTLDNC